MLRTKDEWWRTARAWRSISVAERKAPIVPGKQAQGSPGGSLDLSRTSAIASSDGQGRALGKHCVLARQPARPAAVGREPKLVERLLLL